LLIVILDDVALSRVRGLKRERADGNKQTVYQTDHHKRLGLKAGTRARCRNKNGIYGIERFAAMRQVEPDG
jgi:hypothetical protein